MFMRVAFSVSVFWVNAILAKDFGCTGKAEWLRCKDKQD